MTVVTFITPLSLQDCIARFKENIDSGREFFGRAPVCGSVDDNEFCLNKRILYKNYFQTYCYGRLETSGSNTLIHGQFGLNRFTVPLMIISSGFFVIFAAVVIFDLVTYDPSGASNGTLASFLVFLIAMPLFVWALTLFGRYLARDEQRFLSDFICTVLDAKVTDQGLREPVVKR